MNTNHLKDVIKLGSPLLAGMFAEYIMMIADTMMVGRLGTDYLAAVAIGGLVVEILWVFAWVMAPAVQTLAARRYGTQDETSPAFTGEVFNAGLLFGVAAGIITLSVSFLSRPVISGLVRDAATTGLSMDYIRIIRWSIPISGLYYTIFGFLAGTKRTKQVMIATVGINALNIFLNYLLIFGKLGFPALEIKGAAWGTLIAQAAGLLYVVFLTILLPGLKKYRLYSFRKIPGRLYLDIWRTWFPVSMQHISAHSVFLLYEGIVSRYGAVHLAVIHIVLSIYWLGKAVVGGFADGAAILIGHALGRKDFREAVRYANTGILIGAGIGLALFLLCVYQGSLLIQVFNSDPETIAVGTTALRFFAFFILVGCVGHCVEMVFSHNGWGRFVFIADISCNAGLTLGFTLIAFTILDAPIGTIWLGYALYMVAFTAVLFGGYYSMRWTRIKIDSGIS